MDFHTLSNGELQLLCSKLQGIHLPEEEYSCLVRKQSFVEAEDENKGETHGVETVDDSTENSAKQVSVATDHVSIPEDVAEGEYIVSDAADGSPSTKAPNVLVDSIVEADDGVPNAENAQVVVDFTTDENSAKEVSEATHVIAIPEDVTEGDHTVSDATDESPSMKAPNVGVPEILPEIEHSIIEENRGETHGVESGESVDDLTGNSGKQVSEATDVILIPEDVTEGEHTVSEATGETPSTEAPYVEVSEIVLQIEDSIIDADGGIPYAENVEVIVDDLTTDENSAIEVSEGTDVIAIPEDVAEAKHTVSKATDETCSMEILNPVTKSPLRSHVFSSHTKRWLDPSLSGTVISFFFHPDVGFGTAGDSRVSYFDRDAQEWVVEDRFRKSITLRNEYMIYHSGRLGCFRLLGHALHHHNGVYPGNLEEFCEEVILPTIARLRYVAIHGVGVVNRFEVAQMWDENEIVVFSPLVNSDGSFINTGFVTIHFGDMIPIRSNLGVIGSGRDVVSQEFWLLPEHTTSEQMMVKLIRACGDACESDGRCGGAIEASIFTISEDGQLDEYREFETIEMLCDEFGLDIVIPEKPSVLSGEELLAQRIGINPDSGDYNFLNIREKFFP